MEATKLLELVKINSAAQRLTTVSDVAEAACGIVNQSSLRDARALLGLLIASGDLRRRSLANGESVYVAA